MNFKFKKQIGNKFLAGFTMIELIVVIAIIAVLAGIIMTNITQYSGKAKVARANTDIENIQKAIKLFYAQYGDYPDSCSDSQGCYSTAMGGSGDPYLTVDGIPHYLSEFYKSDWVGYNADFFVKNGYYQVRLFDNDNDGKIGCGYVALRNRISSDFCDYGTTYILCQDCPCVPHGYVGSPIRLLTYTGSSGCH